MLICNLLIILLASFKSQSKELDNPRYNISDYLLWIYIPCLCLAQLSGDLSLVSTQLRFTLLDSANFAFLIWMFGGSLMS